MEFSRTVYYRLRDIASVANKGRTQLRYSKSALELTYEYHTAQGVATTSLDRWFGAFLAFAFAIPVWYKAGVVLGCIVAIITALFFIPGRSVKRLVPTGVRRVTYAASDASFYFATVELAGTPLPNTGAELPLSEIRSFRVRSISDFSDGDPVYGLVEFCRTTSADWQLFAQLPTLCAAWQLEEVLTQLTEPFAGRTVVKRATTWRSKAFRAVARFHLQLPYVRNYSN